MLQDENTMCHCTYSTKNFKISKIIPCGSQQILCITCIQLYTESFCFMPMQNIHDSAIVYNFQFLEICDIRSLSCNYYLFIIILQNSCACMFHYPYPFPRVKHPAVCAILFRSGCSCRGCRRIFVKIVICSIRCKQNSW